MTISISEHGIAWLIVGLVAATIGCVYSYFASKWVGRVHFKYVAEVLVPLASRMQRNDFSDVHLFVASTQTVRIHERSRNPFYWFTHWHDSYSPFNLVSSKELREIEQIRKSQNGGDRR